MKMKEKALTTDIDDIYEAKLAVALAIMDLDDTLYTLLSQARKAYLNGASLAEECELLESSKSLFDAVSGFILDMEKSIAQDETTEAE